MVDPVDLDIQQVIDREPAGDKGSDAEGVQCQGQPTFLVIYSHDQGP
jgi:hypothetical protein